MKSVNDLNNDFSNSMYCKMFFNTELPIDELSTIINENLNGEYTSRFAKAHTITTHILELYLKNNDGYKTKDKDDTFVYWKYYADIDPMINSRHKYIQCIRNLMDFLKSKGIPVVAACDFEEELGQFYNGGKRE